MPNTPITTPNQLSIDGLESNALLNAINSPDKIPFTWLVDNEYNVIEMLMYVKGKKSRPVSGLNGLVQKPIMGVSRVIAQVATATVVGSNLVVTFTDPTYNLFRLKDAVLDSTPSANTGRVIVTAPGTITMEPDAAIFAAGGWNTALHFPVNGYALSAYNVSGFQDSEATTSITEQPYYVTDSVSTMRDQLTLRTADFFKTYTKWKGTDFWANGQELVLWRRFNRQKINRWYFGSGGGTAATMSFNSGLEGQVNYTMGIRKGIMDQYRGGYYLPYNNALTQDQWGNWLTTVADLQSITGNGTTKLTILLGREILKRIQSFTAPYIQFGGNTNTFGGSSVKGLNVYEYSYGGVVADLILDPVLNDVPSYPTGSSIPGVIGTIRQNTAMAIDFGDYASADGSGMLPAIEEIYWDAMGQQTVFAYNPGLLGGSKSNNGVFSMAQSFATNGSPAQTLYLFEMSGLSGVYSRCGLLEPAS